MKTLPQKAAISRLEMPDLLPVHSCHDLSSSQTGHRAVSSKVRSNSESSSEYIPPNTVLRSFSTGSGFSSVALILNQGYNLSGNPIG